MEYEWINMSNKERNKLISQEILNLDCFQSEKGIQWYEKHYTLGHWHYVTNINDAIDLSERIIIHNDVNVLITIGLNEYSCKVTRKNDDKQILGNSTAGSLSEAICLAILQYKGINTSR